MLLKPTRGLRLNKSHPLARGLVGCWLCNEGTGDTVFDLSGNGNTGTFQSTTSWTPGKYGPALDFNGSSDYVLGTTKGISVNAGTVVLWFNADVIPSGVEGNDYILSHRTGSDNNRIYMFIKDDESTIVFGHGNNPIIDTGFIPSVGTWYQLALTWNEDSVNYYINAVSYGPTTTSVLSSIDTNIYIGQLFSGGAYFNGQIDNGMIYNRALTAQEIGRLYREPFCIFDRGIRPELIGGQIVNLAGTSAALSSLSATAKATRKVSGTVASISDVEALLNSIRDRLETERNWLREALFNGMTANAFKLGTILSLGWFWVRVAGCSVLYRGAGMGEIDFVNILAVAESEACEISPPSYISHNSNSTYFYVIRRFNNCGYQEHTLAAAVKVSIDSNGNLAEPQPNNIFSSKVEQVDINKIQLVWFYCPLEQKSQPVCFNVYYDDRTGQIDYQNPLATISYKGRKFYSHQVSALEAGKYLFAIRPEDAGDIENSSLARLRIQLDTLNPDAIDILRAEAV